MAHESVFWYQIRHILRWAKSKETLNKYSDGEPHQNFFFGANTKFNMTPSHLCKLIHKIFQHYKGSSNDHSFTVWVKSYL
jgi:hypothetical protein